MRAWLQRSWARRAVGALAVAVLVVGGVAVPVVRSSRDSSGPYLHALSADLQQLSVLLQPLDTALYAWDSKVPEGDVIARDVLGSTTVAPHVDAVVADIARLHPPSRLDGDQQQLTSALRTLDRSVDGLHQLHGESEPALSAGLGGALGGALTAGTATVRSVALRLYDPSDLPPVAYATEEGALPHDVLPGRDAWLGAVDVLCATQLARLPAAPAHASVAYVVAVEDVQQAVGNQLGAYPPVDDSSRALATAVAITSGERDELYAAEVALRSGSAPAYATALAAVARTRPSIALTVSDATAAGSSTCASFYRRAEQVLPPI